MISNKKIITIFIISFLGILIFNSSNLNAIAQGYNLNRVEDLFISAPGPTIDSSAGNFRINDWDDGWVTQSEVEDFAEVLEDTYDLLVGTWGFPDPMTASGEPPIEVLIKQETGYNGAACCRDREEGFGMSFYPDYINQGFPGDHEPMKVAGHELFHCCQFVHPAYPPKDWVLEGQARMSQDKFSNWLDHADGTEAGTSFVLQSQGYLESTHTSGLTTRSYDACLFWQYYCEQFGSDHTDPDYGIDAISTFWDSSVNPTCTDGITMLNNALNVLSPGTTFEDVFEDFSVAIYAKDLDALTVPLEWTFLDDDETDGSGNYGTVSKEIDPIPTLTLGSSITGSSESIVSWSNKYYELNIDPAVEVITIQLDQSTTNKLFYALLCMNDEDLEYSYIVESQDFNRAIVNNNYDKVVVVVVGLENSASETAYFDFDFEAGEPTIFIESPKNSPVTAQARVGPHNAPEKFVTIMNVYYRQQAPIHGFFTENFQAQVGGIDATVLAAVDVYGKYFLQIQAPNQTTDGFYDLEVELVDSDSNIIDSASELDCVNYGDTYCDIMLNIDRSGSMATSDKILAAKSAGKLLVDSFLSEDQLGVVAFDTDATLMHELMKLTPTNREIAYNKIDGIIIGATTSIGDGLLISQNQLYNKGIGEYPDHIILLSDGMENTPLFIYQVLPLILGNGTIVHVITIGADAAYEEMQELAADTGGMYFHCFDPSSGDIPNDLAELYRAITEIIRPMERFYHVRGIISSGKYKEFKLTVTDDMDIAEFVVHYNASIQPITLELKDPDGTPVSWDVIDDKSGMGRAVCRKSNPKIGEWTIKITIDAISSELRYFVEGAAHTYLTMTLLTPPNGYILPEWGNCEKIGTPIPVLVSLTDLKEVKDAKVYMEVIPPGYKNNGTIFRIPLYDDGNHGDSLVNDGIYGNLYTATSEEGSYQFLINATGKDSKGRPFTRIRTGAFYMKGQRQDIFDSDGDGLPDNWEIYYGLDPYNNTGFNGKYGDPDFDLLENDFEFFYGTDPFNADTDFGGQSDTSEIFLTSNPLDPSDDTIIKFPSVRIYPGNNFVYFIMPNATTVPYESLYVCRSTNPTFGFTIINASLYTNFETFNDTSVTNYQTYYYRFFGMTNLYNISVSKTYTAIPKLNVLSAEACVLINNGNKKTKSNLVDIRIEITRNDGTKKMAFAPTHMRIGQNVSALMKSSWIPFDPDFPLLLTSEKGVKFVFVQLRDDQVIPEISPIFSAGIYYTGEEEFRIGLETTFTVLIISVDFIVITILLYRNKRKNINIKKF